MTNPTGKGGFAVMDKAKLREVCARGGRNSSSSPTKHRFNSETGRKAALSRYEKRNA